jgi:hypothetical protein
MLPPGYAVEALLGEAFGDARFSTYAILPAYSKSLMTFKSPLSSRLFRFPSTGDAAVQDGGGGASVMPRILQALSRAAAEKKRLVLLLGREAPSTSSYWVRNFVKLLGRDKRKGGHGAVDEALPDDASQLAALIEREYVMAMMDTGAPMGAAAAISTVDGKHAESPRLLVMTAQGQVIASVDLRQDNIVGSAKAIAEALNPARMEATEAAIQRK